MATRPIKARSPWHLIHHHRHPLHSSTMADSMDITADMTPCPWRHHITIISNSTINSINTNTLTMLLINVDMPIIPRRQFALVLMNANRFTIEITSTNEIDTTTETTIEIEIETMIASETLTDIATEIEIEIRQSLHRRSHHTTRQLQHPIRSPRRAPTTRTLAHAMPRAGALPW